ncbi:Hpt domain-containing protein [Desulfovibrio mangrovi]|uniref:Hpt domain-containing protein n=1 Tax=Desulfovibrio mangrovi TaxID=2976983 RepID=UPI0022472ECB|nr:Hpt domain-containing protein [Desulfovibrio mangrovi]UZP67963.1 Hpt domain-containing protein [Desulfovibrio mangrovi]
MVLNRQGAMRMLGIDPESYDELLAIMRSELCNWLDYFSETGGNGLDVMRSRAHRLKSDAANIGAERVRHTARALEQSIREGQDEGSVEHFRRVLVQDLRDLQREIGP